MKRAKNRSNLSATGEVKLCVCRPRLPACRATPSRFKFFSRQRQRNASNYTQPFPLVFLDRVHLKFPGFWEFLNSQWTRKGEITTLADSILQLKIGMIPLSRTFLPVHLFMLNEAKKKKKRTTQLLIFPSNLNISNLYKEFMLWRQYK